MKRIILSLTMLLFCSTLFAEKLSDKKLMQIKANYDYIDSFKCVIPETCGIEYNNVFVLFDSDNNTIIVYSTDSKCSIKASDFANYVCSDLHPCDDMVLYKF